jgi:hypothetical protein
VKNNGETTQESVVKAARARRVKACPCREPSCMDRPPHLLMLLVVRSKTPEKYSSSVYALKRVKSAYACSCRAYLVFAGTHVSRIRRRARSARGGWRPAFGGRCLPAYVQRISVSVCPQGVDSQKSAIRTSSMSRTAFHSVASCDARHARARSVFERVDFLTTGTDSPPGYLAIGFRALAGGCRVLRR